MHGSVFIIPFSKITFTSKNSIIFWAYRSSVLTRGVAYLSIYEIILIPLVQFPRCHRYFSNMTTDAIYTVEIRFLPIALEMYRHNSFRDGSQLMFLRSAKKWFPLKQMLLFSRTRSSVAIEILHLLSNTIGHVSMASYRGTLVHKLFTSKQNII